MYGVIDIGSNTIRMMTYRVEGRRLRPVLDCEFAAGLAGFVTPDGVLGGAGIARAVEILRELRPLVSHLSLEAVYPFATASLRNVSNKEEAVNAIRRETGFEVEVLSGEEEALLDYYGAMQGLSVDSGALVDVGGGSTEIVPIQEGRPTAAASLPIGSLKLYARYVAGILPSRGEICEMRQAVRALLDARGISPCGGRLYAVGGTAKAVEKLFSAQSGGLPGGVYPAALLKNYLSRIETDPGGLAKQILKIAPARIHTLSPGVVILSAAAEALGAQELSTSPCGVREGFLYRALQARGAL